MYIVDGIAYAGEPKTSVKVVGIKPLADYLLWLRFNNGESRVFDFKPLLEKPCYLPLKNTDVFRDVYIDYGVPIWCGGDVDIAPEYVYENSVAQNFEI